MTGDDAHDITSGRDERVTGYALRAEQIARAAHQGQVDKSGHAYISHPQRVAARVADDDLAETVAWLHDVVEDTDVTLDDLARVFPPAVVVAVDALTRRPDEGDAYYRRVRSDPLALRVKLADIADNTDPQRQAQLDEPTRLRLKRKYRHARANLLPPDSVEPGHG